MGVTAIFILSSLGFAIIAQAQNCNKPAAGPHMNLRDEYITQETFISGSKAYFACDPGYTSAGGSAFITCTAGTWSTVQLKCEKKSCGSLGELSNGHVDYAGNEFGDTATAICNSGSTYDVNYRPHLFKWENLRNCYMLVGRSSFRCEVNGWFPSRLPVCDAVQCITPASVENGAFGPQKEFYFFGEVVRYSCIKGLVPNGPTELTCSDDGNFSPSPPTCVKVECKDPVIENAVFVSGSRPPHGHMATVTYGCKSGYRVSGPTTVTCNINNQWSPSLPECILTKTPPPPPIVPTAPSTTVSTTKQPKGVTSTQAPTSNFPDEGRALSPVVWIIIAADVTELDYGVGTPSPRVFLAL